MKAKENGDDASTHLPGEDTNRLQEQPLAGTTGSTREKEAEKRS
jgi:hypothetical protein